MRFVVTGTPRCGTGYTSLLLSAAQIPCTHEDVFCPRATLDDLLDWYAADNAGESSWLAWAFLGCLPGPVMVLHQTRDPWQTVDSLANRNDLLAADAKCGTRIGMFRKVIRAHCPEVFEHESDIDRAGQMVLSWNLKIEQQAARLHCDYHRYRIEDVNRNWFDRLCGWVGVYPESGVLARALATTPTNVNEGKTLDLGMEITNPVILDAFTECFPGTPPVIDYALSKKTKRTRNEIEDGMAGELRDALEALAARYGYTRERQEVSHACEQCAAV